MIRRLASVLLVGGLLVFGGSALAQQGKREQANPAIGRGIQFLRTNVNDMNVGQAAISLLALHKADIPNEDPDFQRLMQKVLARFTPSGFEPEQRSAVGIYETGVICMALANADPVGYKEQVQQAADYLISQQKPNGSWDYDGRLAGDCSVSQYALLGLWEADGVGIDIPPRVIDAAALWYMSVQFPDGGWNYHKDELQYPETVSMTAAGVGSLLLCQRLLAPYRRGADSAHPLLVPLVLEGGVAKFRPVSTTPSINAAVNRGMSWISSNYQPGESRVMGQSCLYGLYGMERVGALYDKEGKGDIKNMPGWYDRGFQWILQNQESSGYWSAGDPAQGNVPKVCWAILYLVRSTIQSIRQIEIRKLGAGTQLGGRGLPEDLNNMTVAQGRIVVRPMNGAVEGMIAVLEDPRNTNIDAALAGLLDRFSKQGGEVLRPFRDRFRKLRRDRDPGIRRVACWALARMGDLDLAPELIRSLLDPDEGVSAEARVGLEVLSRKLEGYGPPRGATPEEKLDAAKRWRDWFELVRPPGLDALDDASLMAELRRGMPVVVDAPEPADDAPAAEEAGEAK